MALKKITPSKYQKKIYNFIKKGSGNAVINAKAGSGKTTTLIESMKLIPNTEKVLFVAFNKSIEQELSKKLEGIDNVKVKTYHGLGYSILLENYHEQIEKISEFKYATYINNNIKKLSPSCLTLSKSDFSIYKNNIKQLVDFARFNLSQSSEEIKKLCQKYSINPILNETEIVPLVLKWGKNHINEIDYTDMIWLCIENDIETRYFKFDFIFIDEAQDSSIMQQYLIKKCYKRGTRFVAIGDEFQCINAFAGADNEAFKKFQKEPNTIVLDLPITYRCPKNIISFVKDSNNIFMEPSPNAIDGEIRQDVSPFEPKNRDMVLCRNTAHLVKLYMKYISVNKKCFIKGRSIGESLKTLALQTNKDKLSLDLTKDGVFPRLYEFLFKTIKKEMKNNSLSYEEVVNTNQIMDLIDTIKAIEILSSGISNINELINKINIIFTDDENDGICLSTIHKAKGLEADNVYILCESLMPSKYAKKEWEKISENNLKYVAVTRAKKTLNFICEKQFSPNLFNNKSIIDELEIKRITINKINNININSLINVDYKKNISNDVKQIMNINNYNNKSTNKQKIGANKFSKFI